MIFMPSCTVCLIQTMFSEMLSLVFQIVAHLFCTYMDTHLPSNPRYQQGFTGLHFLKPPCKQSKSSLSNHSVNGDHNPNATQISGAL